MLCYVGITTDKTSHPWLVGWLSEVLRPTRHIFGHFGRWSDYGISQDYSRSQR